MKTLVGRINTVYVVYDPLYERPICVHDKPNMECRECRKKKYRSRGAYQLCEKRFKIKTGVNLR